MKTGRRRLTPRSRDKLSRPPCAHWGVQGRTSLQRGPPIQSGTSERSSGRLHQNDRPPYLGRARKSAVYDNTKSPHKKNMTSRALRTPAKSCQVPEERRNSDGSNRMIGKAFGQSIMLAAFRRKPARSRLFLTPADSLRTGRLTSRSNSEQGFPEPGGGHDFGRAGANFGCNMRVAAVAGSRKPALVGPWKVLQALGRPWKALGSNRSLMIRRIGPRPLTLTARRSRHRRNGVSSKSVPRAPMLGRNPRSLHFGPATIAFPELKQRTASEAGAVRQPAA